MASATGLDGGALVLTLVQSIVGMVWTSCATGVVGGGTLVLPIVMTHFQCIVGMVWILCAPGVGVNGGGVLSDTASIGSTTVPPLTWY